MFLVKGVLKICSKFTGEHPCRSVILIKLQSNCKATEGTGNFQKQFSIRGFVKKGSLQCAQNSQENTCFKYFFNISFKVENKLGILLLFFIFDLVISKNSHSEVLCKIYKKAPTTASFFGEIAGSKCHRRCFPVNYTIFQNNHATENT